MHIELSTDDPAIIYKAIAEATPGLTLEEVLEVTISKGRRGGLYCLSLNISEREKDGDDVASA